MPTRMAATSTVTPPTTPPTIAPMGVDLDELGLVLVLAVSLALALALWLGLGEAVGVPTSDSPRTTKVIVWGMIGKVG